MSVETTETTFQLTPVRHHVMLQRHVSAEALHTQHTTETFSVQGNMIYLEHDIVEIHTY